MDKCRKLSWRPQINRKEHSTYNAPEQNNLCNVRGKSRISFFMLNMITLKCRNLFSKHFLAMTHDYCKLETWFIGLAKQKHSLKFDN